MKSIESRIANVEARLVPEKACIVYTVRETDSELEREVIRQKAIAEFEFRQGVQINERDADFVCLIIHYGKFAIQAPEEM